MPSWTKEQEEAIYKSGTNIIVSAGAGSGKTAVLTERVIKKVENGTHINELLILTFTKAAAAEMKERIRDSLKKNGFDEELKLIDSAYITTFDSYSLSVVKKYHYLLNISSDINICDATLIDIEKNRILDELFDEYYGEDNPLFNKLISEFCIRDDKTIKGYINTMAHKLEMIPGVDEYLTRYIDTCFSDKSIDDRILEFEQLILDKVKELRSRLNDLSIYTDSKYFTKVIDLLGGFLNSTSIEELLTYHGLSIPILPRGSDDEVKAIKEDCSALLKDIYALLDYGNKQQLKLSIIKTKDYVTILIDIISKYLKRVKDYKLDHEMYEFNDIAMLAIQVLKDNPDICDEVKYSLKEILVDEYQDTNDIQEAFISLISNDNVYMVGDVKQSIYRFRNANPYIFKNKYDKYALGEGGMKIDLVKNFRSRDVVLDNINDIFDLVMDNTLGGAEYYDSHRMVFGNTTYTNEGRTDQDYNLEILEYELDKKTPYTKEEVEIFAIARDIKAKVESGYKVFDKGSRVLRKSSYNDYVILMDRATNFDLYKQIFEYVGVPLTLYKDETLNNSNDIYTIKNLVELIIKINNKEFDTLFKYDFISVARSNLYEIEDNDIFNCFLNNSFKETVIYKDFAGININTLTPVQILNIILEKTNYYEKMLNVGEINNGLIRLQKLLEMASSLTNYGYDIYAFCDYLNKIVEEGYEIKYSLSNEGADSVKIMTIHKSKGLEYHICYFSGLYKSFNISDIKDSFIYNNKYGFITPYFEEGINYTFYKELLKHDYMMEEISEKIRLFYVALTRAKEKMIMLLPKKEVGEVHKQDTGVIETPVRYRYRSLADIMYSIHNYVSNYYHDLDIESLDISKDYLFSKDKILDLDKTDEVLDVKELNLVPTKLSTNSFSKKTHDLINKETRRNMDFGTKAHEYLEHADFKNYQEVEDEFINDKIKKLLTSELMKNIQDGKIYKELEFVYTKDKIEYHGIIDLMVEYNNYIDIIDYKLSNVDSPEYIEQLKGYREYVMTKTGKPVNLYLYSIITGEIKNVGEV